MNITECYAALHFSLYQKTKGLQDQKTFIYQIQSEVLQSREQLGLRVLLKVPTGKSLCKAWDLNQSHSDQRKRALTTEPHHSPHFKQVMNQCHFLKQAAM